MVCPNCGKELPDGTSFCMECGTKLGAAGSPNMQYTGANGDEKAFSFGNPDQAGDAGNTFGQGNYGGFGNDPSDFNNKSFNSGAGGFSDGSNPFDGGAGGFSDGSNPFDGGAGGFSGGSNPFDSDSRGFPDSPEGASSWDGGPGDDPFNVTIGEPSSAWNQPPGGNVNPSGRSGVPKPVLVLLIVLAILLFLFGGVLIADHVGVIQLPFLHSEEESPVKPGGDTAEPAKEEPGSPQEEEESDMSPEEEESGSSPEEEEPEEPSQPQSGNVDPGDLGTLSMSVTEIEPSELGEYKVVPIRDVESAAGADGTDAEDMLNRNKKAWKVKKSTIISGKENTIRLSFDKCNVKVVEIMAGNWAGAEEYNADARPTKVYLTMEGYDYPLILNDVQTSHYIVFSRPVETDELNLRVDSISNGTTGYMAISGITVYEDNR